MRRIVIGLVALGWVACSAPTGALAVEEGERGRARAVIEHQLEAFKRDDSVAAYGDADQNIQRMFPSQDEFMAMVRGLYRPVYRPRRYEFGPGRDMGDGFEQSVRIQDEDGVDWDAVYSLAQQPDGTWKISGCRLVKAPGEAA